MKKGIIIAVILLLLAIIVIFLINSFNAQKPVQNDIVPTTVTPTVKVTYDGIYNGNTGVAGGLADVTLTVSGTGLTGNAIYKGVVDNRTMTLPATITGTVSVAGVVTGTVAVSGVQYGQTISLSGPINGQITENIMNCTYSVTGDVGAYGGQISLVKN